VSFAKDPVLCNQDKNVCRRLHVVYFIVENTLVTDTNQDYARKYDSEFCKYTLNIEIHYRVLSTYYIYTKELLYL
jgi:hypothetical protein